MHSFMNDAFGEFVGFRQSRGLGGGARLPFRIDESPLGRCRGQAQIAVVLPEQ
jgi:hypothetical protein